MFCQELIGLKLEPGHNMPDNSQSNYIAGL